MKKQWTHFLPAGLILLAISFFVVSCEKMDMKTGLDEGLNNYAIAFDQECDPLVQDLLFGEELVGGTVTVWNDEDYLFAEYLLYEEFVDDGWCIVETSLYVSDQPITFFGNGNQGLYTQESSGKGVIHDPCVTSYLYEIPLGDWTHGDELYISADAVLEKTSYGELVPTLSWARSSEDNVLSFSGMGTQWTPEQGFDIELTDELVWDGGTEHQNYTVYSDRDDISWASWEWVFGEGQTWNQVENGEADLRRFQASFTIPEGYEILSGTMASVNPGHEEVIPMNDNLYLFVNEELLFWGGTILFHEPNTQFLGMEGRAVEDQDYSVFPETDGWFMSGAIPELSGFSEGENIIDVFAEEFWSGGGMHELGLTLVYREVLTEPASTGEFVYVICQENGEGAVAEGFRTQTQGGWGVAANGNNPGVYRDAHFEQAFPEGLVAGSMYTIILESAAAVQAFLPQGGRPEALEQDYLNPGNINVLAGQTVALTLNVGFDLYDENFSNHDDYLLADLLIQKEDCPCDGWSVQEVLDQANAILGGEGNDNGLSPSAINECVTLINENFVDGEQNNGYLVYP